MSRPSGDQGEVVLRPDALGVLIATLRDEGYRVVGPTVRDGTIVNGELRGIGDLPQGWTTEQQPGSCRLQQRDDDALFGYAVGPASPRREFLPPRHRVFGGHVAPDGTLALEEADPPDDLVAFLGVRACELAAIAIQDRVFLGGAVEDAVYASTRRDALVIAVECGSPAATCFCTSMGTGPAVTDGADLVLTELLDGTHRFLARAATEAGGRLLEHLRTAPATDTDRASRDAVIAGTVARIDRHLDTGGIHDLLLGNLEHPRWDEVASRCLSCGNCTLVCPTCFCTEVEDTTDLTSTTVQHDRRWASCFEVAFSHAGPGSVRDTTRARYRQWMTHKLATWMDQFDSSGCVGCGRCITWCPVGIDITEEAAAIRATDGRTPEGGTS